MPASHNLLRPGGTFWRVRHLPIGFQQRAAMLARSIVLTVSIACSAAVAFSTAFAETEPKPVSHQNLKSPSEFESIGDQADRSRAIFTEIGKLVTHPRCMNCHPAGDHPLQGAEHREHSPPAWRGESGAGVPGASCAMCHTGGNFTLHEAATYQSIPGHPRWQLAPGTPAPDSPRHAGGECSRCSAP